LYHKSASSSFGSYSAHLLWVERRLKLVTLERMPDCTNGGA
jgi:hypothetical protein